MESKTKWIVRLIVILIFTFIGAGYIINDLYVEKNIAIHNESVAKDSTRYFQEQGKQYAISSAYYENKFKDASDIIKMDDKEIKHLQKEIDEKISYISELEAQVAIPDTIYTVKDSLIYIDNTLSQVQFNYINDPWLKVKGKTNLLTNQTKLYDINIPLPLTIGMTADYSLFVGTENPYVQIGKINAVVLERYLHNSNKMLKNHWHFGIYAGWGIQYGILNKTLDTGPQVGLGIMFRF